MGGMLGIVHFDGKPVADEQLQRMVDSIKHRGVDGIGYWQQDTVGMAHLHLWTTPEAVNETQPFISDDQNFVVMLHGRIDNRSEIQHQLQAKSIPIPTDTDVELFLAAYEMWGETFAANLLGDFVGVIFDKRKQLFICCRDVYGFKPFYYYLDHKRFIWSSEFAPFFEVVDLSLQVNEGMVGEYLAVNIASKTETLYQNIYRLSPAHIMLVSCTGQTKTFPYWLPDFSKMLHYRSDNEYAEHFREIFAEAVRCRLRVYGRVGAHLSGGIDSSSVVGMVQHLFQIGQASNNNGFETFSLVFPNHPRADESAYIDDVIQRWQVVSHRFDPRAYDIHRYAELIRKHRYTPPAPNGTMLTPIEHYARDNGFRVLLTGLGGDQWFWGSLQHHLDYLTQLQLRKLWHELQADTLPGLRAKREILREVLPHLLSPEMRFRLRRWLGRVQVSDWIDTQFAQRIQLTERTQLKETQAMFASYAQADVFTTATSVRQLTGIEDQERLTALSGLEYRHPFCDRRIIEFALALPEEQRWYQGIQKRVLRHAMCDWLPDSVYFRTTKGEFSLLSPLVYQQYGGANFFNSLSITTQGWIKAKTVRQMYAAVDDWSKSSQARAAPYSWSLWMIFAVELWFTEFNRVVSHIFATYEDSSTFVTSPDNLPTQGK